MAGSILRGVVSAVLLIPFAIISGCGSESDETSQCFRPLPAPKQLTEPTHPQVPNDRANVTMFVSNVVDEPIRVTVRFDDDIVFDARMSGGPFGCPTEEIYSYRYRLRPGDMSVRVDTTDGRSKSTTVHVRVAEQFVTVSSQRGFPLYLKVTPKKPVFG